jgi:hypothetical protein
MDPWLDDMRTVEKASCAAYHYMHHHVMTRGTVLRFYAMNQALQALLASILTWCFERRTFSEAEALYVAMQSTRSSAMVHRLLSGMC